MSVSHYNILAATPALDAETMYVELEALARRLVQSGRLRIDAGERVNFIRFSRPFENIYEVFSVRELYDPSLIPLSQNIMRRALSKEFEGASLDRKLEEEWARLRSELSRHLEVPEELELKVARLLVQSTHPSVMLMLLWESVPIFVSFAHAIGDMLDITGWQEQGRNSGMQSTGGRENYAIYVSAGGNPFLPEEYITTPYDGRAAMARLMIIAAQEMGHYADIMRDAYGNPIGRFSADLGGQRANSQVWQARRSDITRCTEINQLLLSYGIDKAAQTERALTFYEKHRKGDRIVGATKRKVNRMNKRIIRRSQRAGLGFVSRFPHTKEFATQLQKMAPDMLANLTPQAQVYRRRDSDHEETIACIEALARVPQQVVKWGSAATQACMPGLYAIYYGQVIPGMITAYQQLSGQRYSMQYTAPKIPLKRKLQKTLQRYLAKKKKKPENMSS